MKLYRQEDTMLSDLASTLQQIPNELWIMAFSSTCPYLYLFFDKVEESVIFCDLPVSDEQLSS